MNKIQTLKTYKNKKKIITTYLERGKKPNILMKINRFYSEKNEIKKMKEKAKMNKNNLGSLGKKIKSPDLKNTKSSLSGYYKGGKYLDYILREDAAVKIDLSLNELNILDEIKQSQGDSAYLEAINDLKELKGVNTGLWGKNKIYTDGEVLELRKTMKNLEDDQTIWDTIISLNTEFAEDFSMLTPTQIGEVLDKEISNFFKSNNLKPDNMEYFFAFHSNTNNPHIHLGFFEKEKQYLNRKTNKLEFRQQGKINLESITNLCFDMDKNVQSKYGDLEYHSFDKRNILLNSNKEKKGLIDNYLIDIDKQYFVKQNHKLKWTNVKSYLLDFNEDSYQMAKLLNDKAVEFKEHKANKLTYSKLSDKEKKSIDEITKFMIENNPEIKSAYKEYVDSLEEEKGQLLEIESNYATLSENNQSNTKKYVEINLESNEKHKEGFYNRCGNKVLNTIKKINRNNKRLNERENIITWMQKNAHEKGATENDKKHTLSFWQRLKKGIQKLLSTLKQKNYDSASKHKEFMQFLQSKSESKIQKYFDKYNSKLTAQSQVEMEQEVY